MAPNVVINPTVAHPTTPASQVHTCASCGAPVIAEPTWVCPDCGGIIRLRCFVYQRGIKSYRAECIDLDIATERSTREEAISGLQDAMHGYLSVVFSSADRRGLIPRPSPLPHRLHYRAKRFRDRLLGLFSRRHGWTTQEKFYAVPSRIHCQ